MAKQTGLGDNFYVGGYNLSGDTASLTTIGGGPEPLEVTGIDKSALERAGGLKTGTLEFTSWFNKAAAQEHVALSPLPTADVVACYFRGTTVGNPAAGMTGKQLNYDPSRDSDGALTIDVEMLSNGFGIDWGKSLTAGVATISGAGNGTAVDFGADADLGAQAYIQVISFTGTDVTIIIQDSANGSSGWAAVTGLGFTQITGSNTAERVASGRTENVKRYLRYNAATSGGFSDLQFAVVANQNVTDTQL